MSKKRRHPQVKRIGLEARGTQLQRIPPAEINITREIEYIIDLALRGETRTVSLRELVFFAVAGGDAWILDSQDNLALCLADGGVIQEFRFSESDQQFIIEWTAKFALDSGIFIAVCNDGQLRRYPDYPAAQIRDSLARARRSLRP